MEFYSPSLNSLHPLVKIFRIAHECSTISDTHRGTPFTRFDDLVMVMNEFLQTLRKSYSTEMGRVVCGALKREGTALKNEKKTLPLLPFCLKSQVIKKVSIPIN